MSNGKQINPWQKEKHMKHIIPTMLALLVIANLGYAQNYTENFLEINKEIGSLFSKHPDEIIGAATKLGDRKQEAASAVSYLVRVLKDLETNRMEVIGEKGKVTNAIVNALQKITGQNFGKDVKRWEEYLRT